MNMPDDAMAEKKPQMMENNYICKECLNNKFIVIILSTQINIHCTQCRYAAAILPQFLGLR